MMRAARLGTAAEHQAAETGKLQMRHLQDLIVLVKQLIGHQLRLKRHSEDLNGAQSQIQKISRTLGSAIRQTTADLASSTELLKQEILERQKTEDALSKAREVLEKIFVTVHLAIAVLDTKFKFVQVNRAYALIHGMPEKSFIGTDFFQISGAEDKRSLLQGVLKTGQPATEYARPFFSPAFRDRQWAYLDWTVTPLKDPSGKADGLLVCLADVTERISLSREILEVAERERRAVARDLHDGLGQLLTALSVKSKTMERDLEAESPEHAAEAGDISRLASQLITQTRVLARELYPAEIDTGDLAVSLNALASASRQLFGIKCMFKLEGQIPAVSPERANHVYNIVREAITNAVRHAGARNVRIRLALAGKGLLFTVNNDGKKFSVQPNSRRKGLGLRTIKYRAELMGGSFSIRAGRSGGAVVTCNFPLPGRGEASGDGNS